MIAGGGILGDAVMSGGTPGGANNGAPKGKF